MTNTVVLFLDDGPTVFHLLPAHRNTAGTGRGAFSYRVLKLVRRSYFARNFQAWRIYLTRPAIQQAKPGSEGAFVGAPACFAPSYVFLPDSGRFPGHFDLPHLYSVYY